MSAIQPVVEDQPGADAGRHRQIDEVAAPPARAVVPLGERGRVGIVFDPHG